MHAAVHDLLQCHITSDNFRASFQSYKLCIDYMLLLVVIMLEAVLLGMAMLLRLPKQLHALICSETRYIVQAGISACNASNVCLAHAQRAKALLAV